MAGAQTTLALQDKLTGPLMKMMRAMDQTITVMEKMDSTTQNLDQKSLSNARKSITNASADIERLSSAAQNMGDSASKAADQQDKFNQSVNNGESGVGKLVTGLLSAVGAYKAMSAASSGLKSMLTTGLDFHVLKQSSEAAFTVFLGDAKKAKQYMDDMYAFALTTPFAYPDLLESSRNLMAFGFEAENTIPIMHSIGDAVAGLGKGNQEMLQMADIFGMIQVSGRISMMEINRLQSVGVGALEMLADASGVTADEMKKKISEGAVGASEAITVLTEGMDKQFGGSMAGIKDTLVGTFDTFKSSIRNSGAALLEDFLEPIKRTVTNATNLIKDIPKYLGPAFAAILPVIDKLNNALEAGNFDWFFQMMSAGLITIAWILSGVAQAAIWVANIFANNWSWIEPILLSMASVLGVISAILIGKYTVLGLVKLATLAWAAATWLVNKAFLKNPIGYILMGIVALITFAIYAMIKWSETTAMVIGYIVGALYVLGAVFYNVLMVIANFGIMIAEFFVNMWYQSIFLIQMGWIGFMTFVLLILDAIGNAGLAIAEFFINIWNQAIYLIQLGWIGFMTLILMILDGIGNAGLAVAEFFINVWNDAIYGIEMLFYYLSKFVLKIASSIAKTVEGIINGVLGGISAVVNTAIKGLNKLINLANKIPFVNISTIGEVDFTIGDPVSSAIEDFSDSIEKPTRAAEANLGRLDMANDYLSNVDMPSAPEAANLGRLDMAGDYLGSVNMPESPQSVNFDRLDYKDTDAAFGKGYDAGYDLTMKAADGLTGLVDKVGGIFDQDGPPNPGMEPYDPKELDMGMDVADALDKLGKGKGTKPPKGASNPTGGKLDKIGKIDDEINIADEDLKLLKELADIRSIQNFRTLNPTVTFTGDMNIREEADIDKIVRKLNKNFEDQMGESAEGVYT